MLRLVNSPNYAAQLVEYDSKNVVALPNRDRIVGYKLLGHQSTISKDAYQDGDLLVFFPAGAQLSEDFIYANSLSRNPEKNANPEAKGYIEANRRVKAISLGGNRSDALLLSADSLTFLTSTDPAWLKPGVVFDHVGEHEVCRKYVVKTPKQGSASGTKSTRINIEGFHEHFDTGFLLRNTDKLDANDIIYVSAKVHGTSTRIGHLPVKRDLKWYERIAKRLGVKVSEHEYQIIVGSRRVIKSVGNVAREGVKHHASLGTDIWTVATAHMHEQLPRGYMVYAEIIGHAPEGGEIQKGHTYGIPEKESVVLVYRVSFIDPDGEECDLSWHAMREFCERRGWNTVPHLGTWSWEALEPVVEMFLDKNFVYDSGPWSKDELLPLPADMKDEGICVRLDKGRRPLILKAKSPWHYRYAEKMLEQEVEDLEESQA